MHTRAYQCIACHLTSYTTHGSVLIFLSVCKLYQIQRAVHYPQHMWSKLSDSKAKFIIHSHSNHYGPLLFSNAIHQSHKNIYNIYINAIHATRTTTTRNSRSTMCRGGGSKVSLKLWSRSFPMRDFISCSNFSKASASAGWLRGSKSTRISNNHGPFPSISFHFWGRKPKKL